jgi:hypothetical protein
MTLDEFFEELRRTPRNWKLSPTGAIRMGCDCPVTAVCAMVRWKTYTSDNFIEAAKELGLAGGPRDEIQMAADVAQADWLSRNGLTEMRARLLVACGLGTVGSAEMVNGGEENKRT